MKTQREIWLEARRLERLGSQFAEDQRRAALDERFYRNAFSVLFTFPESHFTSCSEGGEFRCNTRNRRIEVGLAEGAIEYRLLQDESETTGTGRLVRDERLILLATSETAAEVLEKGYDLVEEERLDEALAPAFEKLSEGEFADGVEPHVVEEIEAIVEAGELLPAARLHTRAEIAKLFDGQLEPDEFIARAIQRHRHRETIGEEVAERADERLVIGQP
jgi:hypothetical protein